MANNYTESVAIERRDAIENMNFIFKLRIIVLFSFSTESQAAKAKSFRCHSKIDQCIRGENIEMELAGSEAHYVDEDEGNDKYIIIDKVFKADERSPKAMENLAKGIDEFVLGFCLRSEAEKVIPNIFIPSFGECASVVSVFLNSFPIKCLETDFHYKIDTKNKFVIQFDFEEIVCYKKEQKVLESFKNLDPTPLTYQIFVLVAYYTYFYVDYIEQTSNSYFKEDLSNIKRINKFYKKKHTPKHTGFWNKICDCLVKALSFPKSLICGVVDFLFNYDGHLENRIYSRIYDVLEIQMDEIKEEKFNLLKSKLSRKTKKEWSNADRKEWAKMMKDLDEEMYNTSKENIVNTIYSILRDCKNQGNPISIYNFFESCKYWDYIKDKISTLGIEEECKKWKVEKCDIDQATGFAAILFKNGNNYIYSFKGTDFDSYGKDWISTNLLQGLTGYSLQHHIAISKAQEYDKEIGSKGNLYFVGHSLGGGLASAATISTIGRKGYTFNAAGLNVMGVKVNQLIHNPSNIIHPSQSWNRVFPYRIKGEVLDTLQKTVLRVISAFTLERGYGINSVEFDIMNEKNCLKRHGINNFLYANVLGEVKNFNIVRGDFDSTTHNKIKRVSLFGSSTDFNHIC